MRYGLFKGIVCAIGILGALYFAKKSIWIFGELASNFTGILDGTYTLPTIDLSLIYSFVGWAVVMLVLIAGIGSNRKR